MGGAMRQARTTGRGAGRAGVRLALLAASLLPGLLCAAGPAASIAPPGSAPATAPAASRPGGPVAYQPGVQIDWPGRRVLIAGEVVLRSGDLELFACSPGTKEHESIVRVLARPLHVYQALGLLGYEPGRVPSYDNILKRVIPADGQRLEILVRWAQDGQTRTVPIEQWLHDRSRGGPPRIDWVFAGSMPIDEGQILADYEGTVVTVVDFDGPIIAAAASHSSSNAELWLSAATGQIPPVGTPVTLIVQAARPRMVFQVDRFGGLRRDGQPSSLRQWVQAAGEANGAATGLLQYDPAVPDIQVGQLLAALREAGLADVAVEPLAAVQAAGAATQRTEVEEQGLAILQTLADVSRQLPAAIDAAARSARQRYRMWSERVAAAGYAAAGAARAFGGQAAASQASPAK